MPNSNNSYGEDLGIGRFGVMGIGRFGVKAELYTLQIGEAKMEYRVYSSRD